jgi:hypothetical protein
MHFLANLGGLMKRLVLGSLLFCAGAVPIHAKPWMTVPVELRTAEAPIPLTISLAQKEIRVSDDPTITYGGSEAGIFGGFLASYLIEQDRKKFRAVPKELFDALERFDATAPLLTGFQDELTKINWLVPVNSSHQINDRPDAKIDLLATSGQTRMTGIDCLYGIDTSYSILYVVCTVQIAEKQENTPPAAWWKRSNLKFEHSVSAQTSLDVGTDRLCYRRDCQQTNIASWTQNGTNRFRSELERLLTLAGKLSVRQLALTDDDLASSKNEKERRAEFFAHRGAVIEGFENVATPAFGNNIFKGRRATDLVPDSPGVTLIELNGTIFARRDISVRR